MSNLHRLISVPILKKEWPCQQNNFGESTMIRYSMERSGNAWELRRGKDRDIPFVRTSVTKHQGLWGSVYSDVCVCVYVCCTSRTTAACSPWMTPSPQSSCACSAPTRTSPSPSPAQVSQPQVHQAAEGSLVFTRWNPPRKAVLDTLLHQERSSVRPQCIAPIHIEA